ncbi:twitching motility protein PilH [uncultured Candidatus Thioglobus sp.]|nr:twitching motility protein PilH [uncultured Candidatus Thioglobus sp.]
MAVQKVLIVDDTPADLEKLEAILYDAGCAIVTATNGKDAIAKAREERPDIIFMDIVMGKVDGYEAARTITNDSATQSIPLIFVSNKTQKADRVWAKMQGAKDLVSKPYTIDQILDQLKIYS